MAERKFTDNEEAEIAKIYTMGTFGTGCIARAYGCSKGMVRNTLLRQGVELRSREKAWRLAWERQQWGFGGLFTDEEEAQISAVYTAGKFNATQIARAYGCSSNTIRSALIRQNTKLRTISEIQLLAAASPIIQGHYGYAAINVKRLGKRACELAMKMCRRNNGSCIAVHRLIMALHLRRPLYPWEIVHHKDGNRANYRLDNLELLRKGTHHKGHGNPYYHLWQEALTETEKLKTRIKYLEGS